MSFELPELLLIFAIFQFLLLVVIMVVVIKKNQNNDYIKLASALVTLEKLLSRHDERLSQESQQSRQELRENQLQFNQELLERLAAHSQTYQTQLEQFRKENDDKLNQMRHIVDEKLHTTLEKRLGESFKMVSDRLEMVHKGLGDMQHLATGVGDLKKVLMNVKTRGTWGEIQLGNLLDQVLTSDQYEKNVKTKPESDAVVEFAIKLPGRNGRVNDVIWLPIDAKFPQDYYQALSLAQEKGDKTEILKAERDLDTRIKQEAKQIQLKYLDPPHTTDFAIMFLPTEGLYAEVVRRPGVCETLQNDYRILVAGPTNLAALLNSLQMGFKTLAIEKRSSEIWQLLTTVKTEFIKFGGILDKTQKKLHEASQSIELASKQTKKMESKLFLSD